jgi:hypothetical protein
MSIGKKALLIGVAAALFVAAGVYRDYQWFLVASAIACTLRAFVFTRRY